MQNALAPMAWTIFARDNPQAIGEAGLQQAPKWSPGLGRQLGRINADVNSGIIPDETTVNRPWMIAPVRGCCHDYCVTKRTRLMAEGWSASCLLLAQIHRHEDGIIDHLVLLARTDRSIIILDNLTVALMDWPRHDYALVKMQSEENPNFWKSP